MDTNKLDVMNYQVDTKAGHYYLVEGRDSLRAFAANYGVNFEDLCLYLLNNGQYVDPISGDAITMI